jgi:hypothetical protein
MNNFNSIFEELNKLYEEDNQKAKDNGKNASEPNKAKPEQPENDPMHEAAEEEIAVEEVPEEEEEPRQLICECGKCGALVIKDEAEITTDEETGLVDVEEACQFCEEANGYKIIGVVAPYELEESLLEGLKRVKNGEQEKYRKVLFTDIKKGDYAMENPKDMTLLPKKVVKVNNDGEWTVVEFAGGSGLSVANSNKRSLYVFDTVDVRARKGAAKEYKKNPLAYDWVDDEEGAYLKKIAEALEAGRTLEEACKNLDEDLADWYRRTFDRPASIATQQAWEAELNGEMGEIDDKRRAHLERKFAQQRDWEARHPDMIDESLELTTELENEVNKLIGLYADKLNISASDTNPNVPSGQVQICTRVRSDASKTAHKEMVNILKKAGYKVVADFDMGVNPLINAHMSFITITK